MHYRDGTEAKVGDACRFPTIRYEHTGVGGVRATPVMREGVVTHIAPLAKTCNAQVACVRLEISNDVRYVTTYAESVTLGECERAELPVADGRLGV